jgi:lysozyme family protein
MNDNWTVSLGLVWRDGFDSPSDKLHVTKGDPGGATNGGITQATWDGAAQSGLVSGSLKDASVAQLAAILQHQYWGACCDALPAGLDLLVFNGSMMTGRYTRLAQQCLGLMGHDVDGVLGPHCMTLFAAAHAPTLIRAMSGTHYAYLAALPTWTAFGGGWTKRLVAAQAAALALAEPHPKPATVAT